MTTKQKQTLEILIAGGNLVNNGPYGIRVRDKELNPKLKLTVPSFYYFRNRQDVLKKSKNGFVISVSKINRLHGNSLIKRLYKESKKVLQ